MAWLTTADLTARLPDFDPAVAADAAVVTALIAEAEGYIQQETGETYTTATGTPFARVYYGSGTTSLAVDTHVGIIAPGSVAIASGAAVPSFVDRGRYLQATDSTGNLDSGRWSPAWPVGQKITITADWGGGAAADLLTAARELVVAWYIAGRVTTAGEMVAMREVPPVAAEIIARNRRQRGLRRMFA